MKFGAFPIQDCVGAIVAHTIRDGGVMLKKGHKLTGEDIRELALAGVEQIVAALPEPGDIGENEAADKIGAAIQQDNIRKSGAATGRVNLYAESDGLLTLNETGIHALNNLDERITFATLPHMAPVRAGQMMATIKIIPFALPENLVRTASDLALSQGLMKIWPFRAKATGLIQTRHGRKSDKSQEKTADRLSRRLKQLGSRLKLRVSCAHEESAIAAAIKGLIKNDCELIVIFGASAISDRKDVVPAAIETSGGVIERLGMPVDPGNLLLLAAIDDVAVIGAPGCAKSPKLNGFDWVLERILAGIKPKSEDIALMGPGGLLKEISSRPQPRNVPEAMESEKTPPHITALILAAGESKRMGVENKLLKDFDGKPMLLHAVTSARASKADSVLMVTGCEAGKIRKAVPETETVQNANYADGLSSSLKTGISELADKTDAVIVMLGDMPRISEKILNALIAGFSPEKGRNICVPVYQGKRGNPVLFAREYFPALLSLDGDFGAKHLIEENEEAVFEVEIDSPAIFLDIDTENALKAALQPT